MSLNSSLNQNAQQTGRYLVYNGNGGMGDMPMQEGVTDQTVTVAANGFVFEGHRFIGWNTMPDGSGDDYAPGDDYTLQAEPTVLYAQWELVPVTVTYDANGGNGAMDSWNGLYGDSMTVAANGFTNDDPCMTFTGWNTKPDGTGDAYAPDDSLDDVTGDIVLYAQWSSTACLAGNEGLAQTGVNVAGVGFAMLGAVVLAGVGVVSRRRNRD